MEASSDTASQHVTVCISQINKCGCKPATGCKWATGCECAVLSFNLRWPMPAGAAILHTDVAVFAEYICLIWALLARPHSSSLRVPTVYVLASSVAAHDDASTLITRKTATRKLPPPTLKFHNTRQKRQPITKSSHRIGPLYLFLIVHRHQAALQSLAMLLARCMRHELQIHQTWHGPWSTCAIVLSALSRPRRAHVTLPTATPTTTAQKTPALNDIARSMTRSPSAVLAACMASTAAVRPALSQRLRFCGACCVWINGSLSLASRCVLIV
eukprot:202325-Pleurochrysis_carterae.AAC.5